MYATLHVNEIHICVYISRKRYAKIYETRDRYVALSSCLYIPVR